MPNARQSRFARALARGPLVLDGAMGTELARRGVETRNALWSARALIDAPDQVYRVHAAYFKAGARVATTNTYQATLPAFMRAGLNRAAAEDLLRLAVRLAVRARDALAPAAFVAGSVGPYGAFLADGSEYRGDYALGGAACVAFHRRRIELLLEAGVDVLALETMPNGPELLALVAWLTVNFPAVPAWVSLSLADAGHLRDGTPVRRLADDLDRAPGVVAMGINCLAIEDTPAALVQLRQWTDKPLVVYPNVGAGRPGDSCRVPDAVESALADYADRWRQAGVRLLGGCCGTGPGAIAALARRLRAL